MMAPRPRCALRGALLGLGLLFAIWGGPLRALEREPVAATTVPVVATAAFDSHSAANNAYELTANAPPAVNRQLSFRRAVFGRLGRLAVYFSLFIAVGAIGISAFVVPRLRRAEHPVEDEYPSVLDGMALSVGFVAGILLVIAILTRTLLQFSDSAEQQPGLSFISFVTDSQIGFALAMSTAMGAVVAVSSALAHTHRTSRPWRMIQAIAVVMFIVFWSVSANLDFETPFFGIPAEVFHVVHILSASLWIGMLAVIFVTVLPVALRDPGRIGMLRATLTAYGSVAVVTVGVMILSGLGNVAIHLETPVNFLTTPMGRVLIVKLAVVAVLLGFASRKWRILRRRIETLSDALSVRATIRMELLLAAIVLVITSVMVVVRMTE